MKLTTRSGSLLTAAFLAVLTACTPAPAPTPLTAPTSTPTAEAPETAQTIDTFDTRVRAGDGMSMVYVPAGQFEMGNNADERARPVHAVAVDAFWIDQTEVTNAMFAEFLNAQGNQVENGVRWLEPGAGSRGVVYGHIDEEDGLFTPEPGYEHHPVVEVSWYGAAAYCAWIGARLPTEAEWAYAARGPDSRRYPWGDTYDGTRANYCDANCTYKWRDTNVDDGAVQWAPVGSYPAGASWCGALDMAGNVWEWVQDWWAEDYYARSPAGNPQGPDTGTLRVARGASWFDETYKYVSSRAPLTPSSYRMHWVGIRCAMPAGQ